MRRTALAAAAALLVAGCGWSGCSKPPAPVPATPLWYRFRVTGPQPWNDTLHVAVGEHVDDASPYEGVIVDEERVFQFEGLPGRHWHIRSEAAPTPAERRMLWMADATGVLPAEPPAEPIEFAMPERARIRVRTSPSAGGPDQLTLYVEPTATAPAACATAVRDPQVGLFIALFDARTGKGNAYRLLAPPQPWDAEEFAPGACVVAARTAGHQWTARRADVSPGEFVEFDAEAQPAGGGTVVCEDASAVLLLGGTLGIPAPRLNTDLQFRARWEGVPPGTHRVRHGDGREQDVSVTDGADVRVGR